MMGSISASNIETSLRDSIIRIPTASLSTLMKLSGVNLKDSTDRRKSIKSIRLLPFRIIFRASATSASTRTLLPREEYLDVSVGTRLANCFRDLNVAESMSSCHLTRERTPCRLFRRHATTNHFIECIEIARHCPDPLTLDCIEVLGTEVIDGIVKHLGTPRCSRTLLDRQAEHTIIYVRHHATIRTAIEISVISKEPLIRCCFYLLTLRGELGQLTEPRIRDERCDGPSTRRQVALGHALFGVVDSECVTPGVSVLFR